MIILFDLVGTLFSLQKVLDALSHRGYPPETLHWWFSRLLHTAAAGSLARRYVFFSDAARLTLTQIVVMAGRNTDDVPAILEALQNLEPWPDAAQCLERLRHDGHRLHVLTNSSPPAAHSLLRNGDLLQYFIEVFSADDVQACKPSPTPYRMVLDNLDCRARDVCLVAAHAWDVVGAAAVGMNTVWLSRLEKRWAFPGDPPGVVATGLEDIPELVV